MSTASDFQDLQLEDKKKSAKTTLAICALIAFTIPWAPVVLTKLIVSTGCVYLILKFIRLFISK